MTPLIACTVVTKQYLSYARVLASTLAEHNPGSRLFVLLADRIDGCFDPDKEPFEVVLLEDLLDSEAVRQVCFYYTPFELCCALRGLLHEYMQEKTDAPHWMFFDSDIMVCHSLESITSELRETSILMTAHCTTPVQSRYVAQSEINLLRMGLYNAGFLGVRRTAVSRAFIAWFKDRLRLFGFCDLPRAQNCDQLWLNFVPLFFREVSLLMHPGANVAYWNLYERGLEDSAHGVTANGQPLLFVHFSGLDMSRNSSLTRYSMIEEGVDLDLTEKLVAKYRRTLLANGYETTMHYPYAFGAFDTGERISPAMRRIYYDELVRGECCEGSPFANAAYFRWRLQRQRASALIARGRRLGARALRRLRQSPA